MKKKGFTLVELLVVIAILAVLATVSIVGYTSFIKKANQSADEQEIAQINNYLKAEKVSNSDLSFADAIEVVYANEMDLIPRDEDHVYVWNNKTKEIEYVEKTASLGNDYSSMEVVTEIASLNTAITNLNNSASINSGIIYLDGTFDLNELTDAKVIEVKKDLTIVGDDTNFIVPANIKDTTGVSQYTSNKAPCFILTKEGSSLTLCGVKISANTENNSAVCVAANNCEVNIYDCEIEGTNYAINIRNYASFGCTYYYEDSMIVAANTDDNGVFSKTDYENAKAKSDATKFDATCNVTIKNSKIAASCSAINWKHVGGTVIVDNCTLSNTTADCAVIANEGNGVTMTITNSKILQGTNSQLISTQYSAKNTTITLSNCEMSASPVIVISTDAAGKANTGNKIIIDGTEVASH